MCVSSITKGQQGNVTKQDQSSLNYLECREVVWNLTKSLSVLLYKIQYCVAYTWDEEYNKGNQLIILIFFYLRPQTHRRRALNLQKACVYCGSWHIKHFVVANWLACSVLGMYPPPYHKEAHGFFKTKLKQNII